MDKNRAESTLSKIHAYIARIYKLPLVMYDYELQLPVPLVWVGGFPAHYMGEFHSRLQDLYPNIAFIYRSLGFNNSAFAHEVTKIPKNYLVVKGRLHALWTWCYLERMNPKSVLISGNYPRNNLIAATWAIWRKRELYYLADSNILDRQNLQRGCVNSMFLGFLLNRVTKILSIGARNTEFYLRYRCKDDLKNVLIAFPLPHLYQSFESIRPAYRDPFTFLVFGRLEHVKGVDRIVNAFALLDKKLRQRSRLLIGGDGSARAILEAQVRALGLQGQIEFRGAVSSDKAYCLYEESHALVIASHDEPWGLIVNEALSASIPVIGPFWIGSFANLVIHGETGLVTSDNTSEQLTNAMQQLLNNPERAMAMGLAGRDLVREQGWTIDGSLRAFSQLQTLKDFHK